MSKVIDFNKIQADAILIESTSFQSYGYGIVSQYVMKNKNISINAKGLYAYLASCAGNDKQTYPNQTTICKDLGIKKVDTLRKYMKELQKEGFIKVIKTTKKSLFYKNVYLVADDIRTQEVWKEEYKDGKEIEEVEILEENKKVVPAPTDTTDNKTDKNIKHDSIIYEDNKNMQEGNIDLEEIAIKRLKETYPNFDFENEKIKAIMIKNEVLKVKERIEIDKYKNRHKSEYWKW